MAPVRLKTTLAALAILAVPLQAEAGSTYVCAEEDGTETFTDTPRRSGCRLYSKGVSGPAFSRRTYVRDAATGRISRDWSRYEPIIKEASEEYNLPEYLIKAVMLAESSLNPNAVSSAGAEGLMQLMPGTAAEMRVRDSFNPRENIMGGARYLRTLANMFDGDLVLMLAGYNSGHNRVLQYGNRIPPIAETRDYVKKCLRYYYQFKKEYLSRQEKRVAGRET
jgi:soluble lytic murein transglycosylase-like protein